MVRKSASELGSRAYSELLDALKEPHWRPWLEWYERRINGREETEEIELLFVTLPVDPREKDVAEQNAELARRIAELSKVPDVQGASRSCA